MSLSGQLVAVVVWCGNIMAKLPSIGDRERKSVLMIKSDQESLSQVCFSEFVVRV